MKLFRGWQGANDLPQPVADPTSPPAGFDNGPVIVLVDGGESDLESLEWAAAEAAARGSELRIMHAFRWPRIIDPLGSGTVYLVASEAAEVVLTAAVRRARRIAPSLRIRTRAFPGRQITALVTETRGSDRALVVIGHDRWSGRLERSLIRRLARRTTASVAAIGLSNKHAIGPSAARVVVGVDDNGGPPAALGFAFRAARHRGTGLTVVHTSTSADAEDAAHIWQMAYPEVDVRWTFARGLVDSAVLTESAAAALTVLGPHRRRMRGSASYNVLRLARGPVVMVGTGSD
jgi:hypothetical protein